MNLYLLRHGIAEERVPGRQGSDMQRSLTPEGLRKVKAISKGLRALDLDIDLIISSPFKRAHQTAELVACELKLQDRLNLMESLAPDGNPKDLIDSVRLESKKFQNVLLVGHEPYLGKLVSVLISGDTTIPITLKKGGICKLKAVSLHYSRCATLEWLLTSRQIRDLS